jgi:hypothetical protein
MDPTIIISIFLLCQNELSECRKVESVIDSQPYNNVTLREIKPTIIEERDDPSSLKDYPFDKEDLLK